MLPGFRFLFAATVLSMSILVFGLGAAALLRAAHLQFASIPAQRSLPEPVFAQPTEPPAATLALLRTDPPAPEKAPAEIAAASDVPVASEPAPPAEPEKLAALKPDDAVTPDQAAPAEAAKPETPAAAMAPPAEAATPIAPDETMLAAISDPAPPASEPAPVTIEQTAAQDAPGSSDAAKKIATLGGPEVTVAAPAPTNTTDAKTDRAATSKRTRGQRVKERRRVAHARLRAQAVVQQPADPFATPTITRATR
jgi:hypothetical protein